MKKCSKCGTIMKPDLTCILTSNPPQYKYTCPKCGNVENGWCSDYNPFADTAQREADKITEDTTNWDAIRNLAAMFAMNGLITSDTEMTFNEKQIASMAVSQANELIRELQKR